MNWISGAYECRLPVKWTHWQPLCVIWFVCEQSALVHHVTLMLHLGSSLSPTADWAQDYPRTFIYVHWTIMKYLMCSFTVYIWPQVCMQANIHLYVWNAVLLVWGSLRLSPPALFLLLLLLLLFVYLYQALPPLLLSIGVQGRAWDEAKKYMWLPSPKCVPCASDKWKCWSMETEVRKLKYGNWSMEMEVWKWKYGNVRRRKLPMSV